MQTYTVEQVSSFMGVHPQTVRNMIDRGELKAARVGRMYRISAPDLEAFYQQGGGGILSTDKKEGGETNEM